MAARVLWPERMPLEALMLKRAEMGETAFNSEHMLEPGDPSMCVWPSELLDPELNAAFWFDEWPAALQIQVLALDPSKGSDSTVSDYWSYALFGRDRNDAEYVECVAGRGDLTVMIAKGIELIRANRPNAFVVETNQFQSMLVTPFKRALREARLDDVMIVECVNSENKRVRIEANLTTSIVEKRLRFRSRSPGTMLLIDQLKDFPNGEHDDCPDSLAMAKRQAVSMVNRVESPKPVRGYRV